MSSSIDDVREQVRARCMPLPRGRLRSARAPTRCWSRLGPTRPRPQRRAFAGCMAGAVVARDQHTPQGAPMTQRAGERGSARQWPRSRACRRRPAFDETTDRVVFLDVRDRWRRSSTSRGRCRTPEVCRSSRPLPGARHKPELDPGPALSLMTLAFEDVANHGGPQRLSASRSADRGTPLGPLGRDDVDLLWAARDGAPVSASHDTVMRL